MPPTSARSKRPRPDAALKGFGYLSAVEDGVLTVEEIFLSAEDGVLTVEEIFLSAEDVVLTVEDDVFTR